MTAHRKPLIACHDTLVCAGAKQFQKWCVREGDEKGPLVAVMLTKDVAYALAAAPDMIAALVEIERLAGCPDPNLAHIKAIAARTRAQATGAA